jgi:hypothetical protein
VCTAISWKGVCVCVLCVYVCTCMHIKKERHGSTCMEKAMCTAVSWKDVCVCVCVCVCPCMYMHAYMRIKAILERCVFVVCLCMYMHACFHVC